MKEQDKFVQDVTETVKVLNEVCTPLANEIDRAYVLAQVELARELARCMRGSR